MKPLFCFCAVIGLFSAFVAGSAPGKDSPSRIEESRAAVQEFARLLKGELWKAMSAGGPGNAIQVCYTSAPEIAAHISQKTGWKVARTSLRYRNPGNAPDPWERRVLESFELRQRGGEGADRLEFSEEVIEKGKRRFRYMKAIPTGKVCLHCHGQKLDPAVAAKLKALYPRDKAVGFRSGDIRGAFTIIQPLE
jgi:hypothetical protein